MYSKIIEITPKMAKEMLERNMKNNRRVNHETVNRYARIMKAGGWNLTHQGIAFDTDGFLVDGQHRLRAIVQANVPVEMMVTYDVEHHEGEAFTIDAGRRRTTLNIMQISGIDDVVYKNTSSYVTSYLRWKPAGGRKVEATEVISYIERHYAEIAELYSITRKDLKYGGVRFIPAIVGAALLAAIYRGENQDALQKFCNVYSKNEVSGCEGYNPRHALNIRDYVRDHRDSKEAMNRVESAIFAFCNNRSNMRVRDDCYPYKAEMDA